MNYLLAHDLGTSGNKACLYTTDGKLIRSITYPYDTHYFNNNWAEQNADDWWQAVCLSTKSLLENINPKDILGISFSGQMQGCVCVDQEGNALRPAIIWADQRATQETRQLLQITDSQEFYYDTGHRPSPAYSLEKLMWVKEHEPYLYARTYKMLCCKDYIVLKLTGVFATDYSDASGTNALNINKKTWDSSILFDAKIPIEKLPDTYPSTTQIGCVTQQASALTGLLEGTPVVIGAGDGVCATVGAGCVTIKDTYSCIGSSAWIATIGPQPIIDTQMRTFNFVHMTPDLIVPCGTMQSAGTSYKWFRSLVGNTMGHDELNQLSAHSPIGSKGLLFLPYLIGERSPWWNADARGAFIGLKMEHKQSDLLRSVLEGIIFNLEMILHIFKDYMPINAITAIGGGAKNNLWV
ncbi:MAG: xylulokinase, partial [Cellulosilyticaceae bacterium]